MQQTVQTAQPGIFGRLVNRSANTRKASGPLVANALMHLVNDGCFVALYPILPIMAKEFGLTYAQIGTLKTALSTSSTLRTLVSRCSRTKIPPIATSSPTSDASPIASAGDELIGSVGVAGRSTIPTFDALSADETLTSLSR